MTTRNTNKKDFYLTPTEFFDATLESLRLGRVTDKLGAMFMLLSEKQALHRNFIRYYHLREEIIGESIAICMKAFPKFKPYRKDYSLEHGDWDGEEVTYHHSFCHNPHAFFTTSIRNHLFTFLDSEYNQVNIINKKRVQLGLDPSHAYADAMKSKEETASENNDNNDSFDSFDDID